MRNNTFTSPKIRQKVKTGLITNAYDGNEQRKPIQSMGLAYQSKHSPSARFSRLLCSRYHRITNTIHPNGHVAKIPIESTLLAHLARYPAMQLADVYKLIHQAALGSEHAIRDPESARSWLTRELAGMGEGIPEPLTDPLSDETGIVRIHLRPYIASGGDPAQLLEAFIRTANEFRGSTQTLGNYWEVAARLGHFRAAGMDAFIQSMRAQNYPAIHHSTEYERLYRPAYRVVKKEYLTLNG